MVTKIRNVSLCHAKNFVHQTGLPGLPGRGDQLRIRVVTWMSTGPTDVPKSAESILELRLGPSSGTLELVGDNSGGTVVSVVCIGVVRIVSRLNISN